MAEIKVWGTRGSFPQTGEDFRIFGGNTSCFSIEDGGQRIILDAGTGIVNLGKEALKAGDSRTVHIFLGHMHMDHILGLLVFPLFYCKEARIHLYGEERDGRDIKAQLGELMRHPFWPVEPKSFAAEICCHTLEPGRTLEPVKGIRVSAIRASHPDQGMILRVNTGEKQIVYGLDSEIREMEWEALKTFCHGSDLIIGDAAERMENCNIHRGWGHSSWQDWVCLAKEAGAIRLLCSHFGSDMTDAELEKMEREAVDQFPGVRFAREGDTVTV